MKPSLFGQSDNLARPASDLGGKLTRVYNGFDATMNARFGRAGQLSGGLSMGRTVTNNCLVVDSPQDARPGFCKVTPPWSAGSQVKFLVDLSVALGYFDQRDLSEQPRHPDHRELVVAERGDRAVARAQPIGLRGRRSHLQRQPHDRADPTVSLFEPRPQQVDLRFSRVFTLGGTRRIASQS